MSLCVLVDCNYSLNCSYLYCNCSHILYHSYLETCDTAMHVKAKAEIKKYYEKNEAGGPSLKECLRATVGETYWKVATDNLIAIQQHEKKKKREQSPAAQPSQDLIQARQMLQRGREEIAKVRALKDEEIAKLKALKDEEIAKLKASKDEEIASKDSALVQDEEELARLKASKDEEIAEKDKEIATLKATKDKEIATLNQSLKRRESELLKQYMTSKPLVDKVDLTTDDNDEPPSKRRKCIAGIVLEEKEKRLVKIKQEQVETRADLQRVEDEKELALECKICFEVKEERYALVPCGHIMCSVCKESYSECPTCSRHVESHLRVHL